MAILKAQHVDTNGNRTSWEYQITPQEQYGDTAGTPLKNSMAMV